MKTNKRRSYSLTELARELSTTRETLRKRLTAAGVQPADHRSGSPRYFLRDALAGWLGSPEAGFDPNGLPAFQRRAFFQSERERLRLLAEARELIPRIESEQSHAFLVKTFVQALESGPDVLERDVGLTPAQIKRLEEHFDAVREELYSRLIADDTEEAEK